MHIVTDADMSAMEVNIPGLHHMAVGSQRFQLRCNEVLAVPALELDIELFNKIRSMVADHVLVAAGPGNNSVSETVYLILKS